MEKQAYNNNQVSVSEAIEEYKWAINQLSPKTQENYIRCLDEFALWCIREGLGLGDIRQAHIRKYTQHLSERTNKHKDSTGKLTTGSVQTHLRSIKVFMRWASKEELFEDVVNEKTANNIKVPTQDKQVVEIFSEQEIQALMQATKYRPTAELQIRDYAIVCMLLDTGIRNGELVSLTLDNVHVQPGRESYILVDGKTGEREVALGLRASKALHRYIARYRNTHNIKELHVFLSRQHTPLTENTLHQIIEDLGKWTEIENCHPHRFRHTFAVNYLEQGGDTTSLQRLLGHSSPTTTAIYTAAFNSRMARNRGISVLDRIMK